MLLGQVLGGVGLVLVLSTPLTFMFAGFGWLFFAKLMLGAAFIAYYLISNRGRAKNTLGNRSTALWLITATTTLLFIFALFAVNFIAFKNQKEFDMTRDGLYTLADQTVKTLKGLNETVTVYAFYRSDEPQFRAAKETLDRYASFTEKLKVEFVDPVSKPELAEKYQIRENGSRVVFTSKMYEGRPKDLSEQELTNALIKSTSSALKKIYFLKGHGELDIDDESRKGAKAAAELLRNEGYTVETFELSGGAAAGQTIDLGAANAAHTQVKIPDDAQVVIILAPKTPLADPEVQALSAWIEKGGKVFAAAHAGRVTGVEKLAALWHLEVRGDLIVDPSSQLKGLSPAVVLAHSYEQHPITQDFRVPVAMPFTRSLSVKDALPGAIAGATAKLIAQSGKDSWGETEFANGQARFDDGKDQKGPLGIIGVSTKKPQAADKLSDEGRLVVSGSAEFIDASSFALAGNADFFVNSINYLAEEEGKISIRPKQRGATRIALTETQGEVIKFFSLDLLPVAILAIGVAVRGVRRRK
ncbi:MAG: GldG family protein [Deltaproteobacteria bacterium]|nr:GldG family protein [Deltaproteobacteria bacterium]